MYHMPGFGDFLNELLTLLLPGAMDHIIWPILQPILENLIDTVNVKDEISFFAHEYILSTKER